MERPVVRVTSLVAFAIVLTTDILYVTLIIAQNQGSPTDTPYIPRFVASYLAVMAALIVLALVPRPEIEPLRFPMRAAAAAGLLGLGILAAMSIGLPLVAAGILVGVALGRTQLASGGSRMRRLAGVAAAVLSLAVGVVGLDVAGRAIVCPAVGTSSGGGAHLLGGSYQYECNNGELHWSSGSKLSGSG
jgi:hypothetical protein